MNILRELRTKKGVYQKDVAKYLGVDRTTYVKYERGDSEPSIDTVSYTHLTLPTNSRV